MTNIVPHHPVEESYISQIMYYHIYNKAARGFAKDGKPRCIRNLFGFAAAYPAQRYGDMLTDEIVDGEVEL